MRYQSIGKDTLSTDFPDTPSHGPRKQETENDMEHGRLVELHARYCGWYPNIQAIGVGRKPNTLTIFHEDEVPSEVKKRIEDDQPGKTVTWKKRKTSILNRIRTVSKHMRRH